MNARVGLNLSDFLECGRQYSFLLIDFERDKTVGDVEEHIRRVFNISEPLELQTDGWHLPSSEDSRLLRDGDIISVIRAKPPESSKENKKSEKRRKRKLEQDGNESASTHENTTTLLRSTALVEDITPQVETDFTEIDLNAHRRENEAAHSVQHTNEKDQTEAKKSKEKNSKEHADHTAQNGVIATKAEGKESSQLPVDMDGISTTEANFSGVEQKRKRTRRKKKKPLDQQESMEVSCNESPYLKQKQLFGVGHILEQKDKKHIFFPDNLDEVASSSEPRVISSPQAVTADTTVKRSLEPRSPIRPHSNSSISSAGELSKLFSLQQQRTPVVFERKKPDNLIIQVHNGGQQDVMPNENVKGPLLSEIPVKDTVISFKVLKMVNYSPQYSGEVIARVCSVDVSCGQLEVKILHGSEELREENGKFSLDEECDNKSCESASLNWNELVEPRFCQIPTSRVTNS